MIYSINAINPFRFTSPSPLSIPPTERPSLVSSRPQLVSTTPLTPIHVTSTPSYYFHTSTPDSYSYAFQVGPLFCAFCLKNLSSMLLLFHFDCNGLIRRLNVSVFFSSPLLTLSTAIAWLRTRHLGPCGSMGVLKLWSTTLFFHTGHPHTPSSQFTPQPPQLRNPLYR